MKTRVRHFVRRPRPNVFSIERLDDDIRRSMPDDIAIEVWTCRHYSRGVLPRLSDMWAARRKQSQVNHVTGDVHFLAIFLQRSRTIITVHDLVLLERLTGLRRLIIWIFWYWLPVRRSALVVTISESTRAALVESLRCNPLKVRVIHNCISDEFVASLRPFNILQPRILQIGTGINKNLERVARALVGLPCIFVVVGQLSETQLELLDSLNITYENYVGLRQEQLVRQYMLADMVVFASTYEGFGLPIAEAQAVGRPVVTSCISSMPEVAGGAACLVDPFDTSSIRDGILRVVQEPDYRTWLIEAGLKNVERFRSCAVAAQYAALYRQVANNEIER